MIARFHYDQETLDRLLHDQLGDDERHVADHVETCEVCQQQIDTLSRQGLSWDEVGDLLGTPLTPRRNSADSRPEICASAISFLDPTEHPESLGRFARFEIMEILGRGGMGIVMRGYDTSLNRHSAVKVLAPELASSAAARKRFSREAKSAAAVVHPHVVPIQTVDQYNDLPYLVMPVVEGQSLDTRICDAGPLSPIEAVRIAAQVAEGLAAAHDQGLVHRDIKPANVLLENGVERVQITDFGLARAIDDASMTRSGVIAGTPQYMSPEQAHGDSIDHRSDLFSLGSLIYFMLTGRSPFRAETTMGVLNRIGNDQPRGIRSINADVPEWLEQIVMKLLSKSPEDRFQTAAEVAELLQGWHAYLQQPDTVSPPQNHVLSALDGAGGSGQGSRNRRLRHWLIAVATFGFLSLAGVLIVLELNKGTLTIESEADDVPIRIMQGEKVVGKLRVAKSGDSVRVSAGQYVVEVDGGADEFIVNNGSVTLKRGGKATVTVTRSNQAGDPAGQQAELDIETRLIGSWRLMDVIDDESLELEENIVLTFSKWTMTWMTEPDSVELSIYHVLPDGILQFVLITDATDEVEEREVRYRYAIRESGDLELQMFDADGNLHSGALLLCRLHDSDELSTYVSRVVPVDTSESYGWVESEIVNTHARLVRSEKFLASLDWPQEVGRLAIGDPESLDSLRSNLIVTATDKMQVEIGMHGHVKTKEQRDRIVESIANAYREKVSQSRSVAARSDIQKILKSHADVVEERKIAEADHQRLSQLEPTNEPKMGESRARLKRLNDLITKLSDHLLEYGVPAISGSLDLSLERAAARKLGPPPPVSEATSGQLDANIPSAAMPTEGDVDPRSLTTFLRQYNKATEQERRTLFDPPVEDLEPSQLKTAFGSASKAYRKLGKHSIADALENTRQSERLDDRLHSLGVTVGTQNHSKETGEVTFRQILPHLECETGLRSRQFIALSDVELRWSRDGWSSPDWGKIHPPITGDWKLIEIKQDDEVLDAAKFEEWRSSHIGWSQLSISDASLVMAGSTPAIKYDLALDYSAAVPTYQLSSDGEVKFRGVFMGNGFNDDTELRVMVAADGGESPKTFRAKDDDALCLVFRRIAKPVFFESERRSGQLQKQNDSREAKLPRPKFATPEALMRHFADSQLRGDSVGCIDCYCDEVIHGFATSYLMTAMMTSAWD